MKKKKTPVWIEGREVQPGEYISSSTNDVEGDSMTDEMTGTEKNLDHRADLSWSLTSSEILEVIKSHSQVPWIARQCEVCVIETHGQSTFTIASGGIEGETGELITSNGNEVEADKKLGWALLGIHQRKAHDMRLKPDGDGKYGQWGNTIECVNDLEAMITSGDALIRDSADTTDVVLYPGTRSSNRQTSWAEAMSSPQNVQATNRFFLSFQPADVTLKSYHDSTKAMWVQYNESVEKEKVKLAKAQKASRASKR
jgi:hypothetical protein